MSNNKLVEYLFFDLRINFVLEYSAKYFLDLGVNREFHKRFSYSNIRLVFELVVDKI